MLANVLTISRLAFLAVCVYLLLYTSGTPTALFIAFLLVLLIIFIDAIDGTIARSRGEASALGSVLDIAIDRVVENVFWITYTAMGLVPVWAALLVVTRGILTDAVRGFALARGTTAFEMMTTRWGRWLVSHRFMRAVSGVSKVVTFAGLVALAWAQQAWVGNEMGRFLPAFQTTMQFLVILTVAVNLIRGIPVLIESRRFFKNPQLT